MKSPRSSPNNSSRPALDASSLKSLIKRRRVLPLGTTAAAAIGLAGCAMGGGAQSTSHELFGGGEPSPVVVSTQKQVQEFTDKIDLALDQVDRDRLRAAAERKNSNIATAAPSPVVVTASAGESAAAHPAPSAAASTPPAPVAKSVPAEVATPARPAPSAPVAEASATPLSSHAAAEAVIDPIQHPQASPTSAMGAMAAMASTAAPREEVHSPSAPPTEFPVATAAEPSVEDALAVLRKRVAAHPTLNTALALALLDTGDAKSADLGKSLSDADQKVFSDLFGALQGMNAGTTTTTLADRTAPLVNAIKKWQSDADLSLPRLVLATRVDSFGVFTPIEPKFEGGSKHTVIIYCEVANFTSKKSDDGWYQTHLSQQETLITEDGLLIWRPNVEEVDDRSLNQRHDFYLVKKLTIPDNLAAGKYTLRMSVTDKNTNKISMVSLPIEIVGK